MFSSKINNVARRVMQSNVRSRVTRLQSRKFSASGNGNGASDPRASAAIAGAAGGGLVLVAGYLMYRSSELHSVVQKVTAMNEQLEKAKDTVKSNLPDSKQALAPFRMLMKQLLSSYPGAEPVLNSVMDGMDTLWQESGPEMMRIVSNMFNELKDLGRDPSAQNLEKGQKVVRDGFEQLAKLVKSSTPDALKSLYERFPDLKEHLEKYSGQLSQMTMDSNLGGEASKALTAIGQIMSGGMTPANIAKATALAKETVDKAKSVGSSAGISSLISGKSVLSSLLGSYAQTVPALKNFVSENADAFKKVSAKQWEELESIGKHVLEGSLKLDEAIDRIDKTVALKGLKDNKELLKHLQPVADQLQKFKPFLGDQISKLENATGDAKGQLMSLMQDVLSKKVSVDEALEKAKKLMPDSAKSTVKKGQDYANSMTSDTTGTISSILTMTGKFPEVKKFLEEHKDDLQSATVEKVKEVGKVVERVSKGDLDWKKGIEELQKQFPNAQIAKNLSTWSDGVQSAFSQMPTIVKLLKDNDQVLNGTVGKEAKEYVLKVAERVNEVTQKGSALSAENIKQLEDVFKKAIEEASKKK